MDYTQEMTQIKEEIIQLIETHVTSRDTVKLLEFLETSDFYHAPCSRQYHLHFPGGLAKHSLNVYKLFSLKNKIFKFELEEEAVVLMGILHDACKINAYKIKEPEDPSPAQLKYLVSFTEDIPEDLTKDWASKLIDWYKTKSEEPMPKNEISYVINDDFPFGHGEKSVVVINEHFQLTKSEMLAIRFHIGTYDTFGTYFTNRCYMDTKKLYPFAVALFTADYEACYIMEQNK